MQELLDKDAAILVVEVFVEVDESRHGVHRASRRVFQRFSVEQMADEEGGEKVARAVILPRDFLVVEAEKFVVEMVETDDAMLSVDDATGDEHRFRADFVQFSEHLAGFVPRDAVFLIGNVGEQGGLGVVGESQIRHRHHAPHDFDLLHRKAVVEASAVAHHGIDENFRAFGGLFATVVADELCLFLGIHIARANGVAAESELFPDGQRSANVVGGVKYVEKAVIKGVRDECRRQIESRMTQIRQHGQHGSHADLAVSDHIVYEENLHFLKGFEGL